MESNNPDFDIELMDMATMKNEIGTLRTAIRKHRSAKGHDLCHWQHSELWSLLPEQKNVDPQVPCWPAFMYRCAMYRSSFSSGKFFFANIIAMILLLLFVAFLIGFGLGRT